MNKKQLIVAWVITILIASLCIGSFCKIGTSGNPILVKYGLSKSSPIEATTKGALLIIPVLIIGGLLIYTLRDRKK